MTRLIRIFIILIFAVITCAFLTWKLRPDILRAGYRCARNLITHCNDYQQKNYSAILNDKLPDYISLSAEYGIKPCRDEAELYVRAKSGELTEVKGGNDYVVDDMHFSYPFLTREAAQLIEELSACFKMKISETRLNNTSLIVTSMTRTTETNDALSSRNSNASVSSPHLYGNTFDITYVRYKSGRLYLSACDRKYLQAALSEVIWQFRKNNRCWVTFERTQHCFHIVAR